MKGLMWKLLRKHVSVLQLGGFAVANLIGLTIVILAVHFYRDVRPIFNDDESFIKRDYLVITRKVTGMGALMGGSSEFSTGAIQDIENQDWVRTVGRFQTSEYSVNATVGLGSSGHSMQTQIFFESIPDEFLDVSTSDWKFDANRPEVPVIVSKDYLSLYNFGFAAAQGMPKVSEGMMSMIPLQFTLHPRRRRRPNRAESSGITCVKQTLRALPANSSPAARSIFIIPIWLARFCSAALSK